MRLKSILQLAAAVSLSAFFTFQADAQQLKTPAPSPLQTLDQAFALSNIKIEYSRPSVKGRAIFGDLVPFDNIWRTGANAATKITFGEDVKIMGNDLKAGTYALYSVPHKDTWEIMFYKDLTLGGNVSEYVTEQEALRIKVRPETTTYKTEMFTINITEMTASTAKIQLAWDKTAVAFEAVADVDTKIMKNIDNVMFKDSKPYFQAANYYYENNKDMNRAAEWAKTAMDLNPTAYWISHLYAKINYKLKNYDAAVSAAEKSMATATEEKDMNYVALNKKLIEEIRANKK